MKPLHVVAAVILGERGRILIARRPHEKHMGGLWEFPGGKVELGEAVTDALCRELDEELGIQPLSWQPLIRIHHHYPDKSVLLDVWTVTAFSGEPHGREGQPVRWVESSALVDFEFPAANKPIVAAAQLPGRYLVTGRFADGDDLLARVRSAMKQDISLVQFRAPWLSDDEYRSYVRQLLPVVNNGSGRLIVKGELDWLEQDGIAGLHLTSKQLESLHGKGWKYQGQKWLVASCHNQEQLQMAADIGASCATLSPVLPTAIHSDAIPLDWVQAGELIEQATLPVYCLGGMTEAHLQQAVGIGAQGIAAIRSWW